MTPRTHVICQDIQRPVIGISLLLQTIPEIMLRNEVSSTRMQTASEKTGHEEVTERADSHELDDDHIEDNLDCEVD